LSAVSDTVGDASRAAALAVRYAADAAEENGHQAALQQFWNSCAADAGLLEQRVSPVTLVLSSTLWPGPSPDWAFSEWAELEQALLDANEDWEVWTDWYEARLKGGEADQIIEVARATIPSAMWDQGPMVVNAKIRRMLEERGIWRHATAGLGEPSNEAPDGDDVLQRRLTVLSIPEVVVIGARAALRALPLMSFGSPAEPTFSEAFLKMLRITSPTWAAAAYPTQTPNLVPLNAARIDAINSRVGLVRAAAGAAAAYSANQFDKILEEVALGIRALGTASSYLDGDAGAAAFDLALTQDLNDLLGAPEGSASLAQLELWPGGAPPEWMVRRWEALRRDLIRAGLGWEIWVQWYEDRLWGRTRSA
jgi:hypothetical protein